MNLYGKNYKLVWEDHFEGNELDPGIWDVKHLRQEGHDGKGAWRKPENVTVENSNLVIRARMLPDGDYSSGMVRTDKALAYKYGYAEIRAKLPKGGPGIWPGFWMCAPVFPNCGPMPEIDVFEMFGDDSYIACNIHAWWKENIYGTRLHINYLDGQGYPKKIYLKDGSKFSDDYHTIGYEWTPELVQFLVDGEPYCTVTTDNPIFQFVNNPIYIIISMAYGLPFLKPPVQNGEPVEYFIDYIRLYQNEDGKLYRIVEGNIEEIDSVDVLKTKK